MTAGSTVPFFYHHCDLQRQAGKLCALSVASGEVSNATLEKFTPQYGRTHVHHGEVLLESFYQLLPAQVFRLMSCRVDMQLCDSNGPRGALFYYLNVLPCWRVSRADLSEFPPLLVLANSD